MFEQLGSGINNVLQSLKGQGLLKEKDVVKALDDIQNVLLEADVALPAAKAFLKSIKDKALQQKVLASVAPGQQIAKVVHDELTALLSHGDKDAGLNLVGEPPQILMLVGLNGVGKTTTAGKLALYIKQKLKKTVMVASLDARRPAAQEQLAVLANDIEVAALPIIENQSAMEIAQRALDAAKLQAHDVLILDTAGRQVPEEGLMLELTALKDKYKPHETIMVVDAMAGQSALETAKAFNDRVGVSGFVLSRADGDARGGAALSVVHGIDKPIKFLGTGEKTEQLEAFDAARLANRILGMGDVLSLVEKAQETEAEQEAKDLEKKLQKGRFDLEDMAKQLKQLQNMGGIKSLLGMMPGMGGMAKKLKSLDMDEDIITRMEAMISSMTKRERKHPQLLNASRKRRVAAGSGTDVPSLNRLLKQHHMMQKMMKKSKGLPSLDALSGQGLPTLPPNFRN